MAYVAAFLVVAGVALYVAAPLIAARPESAQEPDTTGARELEVESLMHQRSLAIQALKELEFDRELNKLSDEDYRGLRAPLEERALGAMAEIERLRAQDRAAAGAGLKPEAPTRARPVERRRRAAAYCPQCGERVRTGGSFCVECGTSLNPPGGLAMQAE